MAQKKRRQQRTDPTVELLRDLLTVELAKAGVRQTEIREIVGGGMNRVNLIAGHFRKAKREEE